MRPKKKRRFLALKIVLLVMFLSALGVGAFLINAFLPTRDMQDYFEFHELAAGQISMVDGDEIVSLSQAPIVHDGEIYFPVELVEQTIDEWIFWDDYTKRLTITNPYFVIKIDAGERDYLVNGREARLERTVIYRDGTAFIPVSLLEHQYNVKINYSADEDGFPRIVWVNDLADDMRIVYTAQTTALRFEPHRWSPVIENLDSGSRVHVFTPEGESAPPNRLRSRQMTYVERVFNRLDLIDDSFRRVRTEDGLVGYILFDDMGEVQTIEGIERELVRPDYFVEPREIDGRVVMVWDMMEFQFQNNPETKMLHQSLDVISPQWFRFDRETYSGQMLSIACHDYMRWAHERGLHIWPKIFDNEDPHVTNLILTDQVRREWVIEQILDFIDEYNLDGINIDFERIWVDDIRYFHQFLRELWPPMRERGAVLSAAVFVPSPWSFFFDRGAIAQTVDFVAVMAYDEHTIRSPDPGPNASIGFVTDAVYNMVFNPPPGQLPVPAHQLILCVPFYTRVWIETIDEDGNRIVTYNASGNPVNFRVRSLGMNYARRTFEQNGAVFEWQEDIGKYFAEFETYRDGDLLRYSTWLECDRSMARKIELVTRYDLAGVAAWVWGLEKAEIWELFYRELK